MEIDFLQWLIDNGHYNPEFVIDFSNPDWEQITFEIQSQLSYEELYYLSGQHSQT